MADAFRGEFNQKVDRKARVSIPSAFRKVIEAGDPDYSAGTRPKFFMIYGGEGRKYLECRTVRGMRRLEKRILAIPEREARRAYLTRHMIRMSLELEIDGEGRIVLPPKARDKIGLTAEVLDSGEVEAAFAGDLDKFQLWNGTDYEADMAAHEALAEDILPAGADMLSLLPDDDDDTED